MTNSSKPATIRRTVLETVAAMALVASLVGCGGGATYADTGAVIDDINEALSVPACGYWDADSENAMEDLNSDVNPILIGASASATCNDSDDTSARIAIFSSTENRDATVEMVRANHGNGDSALVGKNWLYVGPDADKLADKMGGEVVGPEFDVD